MSEMSLVRELSAQITQMIPAFVRKHHCAPTVVFLPPAMAHDLFSEMLGMEFEPGMPPPTVWLVDMVVMVNAGVTAPELASFDLHPYFQPARRRDTPNDDTIFH